MSPLLALLLATAAAPLEPAAVADRTGCTQKAPAPGPVAEWTVMLFVNGDNNLESAALRDFLEMAEAGSSADVHVLLQVDLLRTKGTRRFRVTQGMKQIPKDAASDLGEVNMGEGKSLECFVTWALAGYPSRKTALVIWDHGQGWRDPPPTPLPVEIAERQSVNRSSTEAPYKSVSRDDTDDDELYNREAVEALRAALRAGGRKLDVLAFDACLMAMLESAYAFRDVASFLVSSQELVPNTGFDYRDLLGRMVAAQPRWTASELAKQLVASYESAYEAQATKYGLRREQTLSALDLDRAKELSEKVSAVAEALTTRMPAVATAVRQARCSLPLFAPRDGRFHHVDLDGFLQRVGQAVNDTGLSTAVAAARTSLAGMVVKNYAGTDRASFPAAGLCIYFPADRAKYDRDSMAQGGYRRSNTYFPVEFVKDFRWGDFLERYWTEPLPKCDPLPLPGPGGSQGTRRPGERLSRRALVIGNSAYEAGKLPSARDDAAGLADALERVDFDVTFLVDRSAQALRAAFDDFLGTLQAKDTALVFYAGHGLQLDTGRNYLVPVDARFTGRADVERDAYGLEKLYADSRFQAVERRLVILDACRRNPWNARGGTFRVGLAEPVGAPAETLIAYAAEPGGRAADGDLADFDGVVHSPFTLALLRFLRRPGLPVEEVFKNSRELVWELTDREQRPWETTNLVKPFRFRDGARVKATFSACDDVAVLRDENTSLEVLACGLGGTGTGELFLQPGDNRFSIFIFNQKTCRGGQCWLPWVNGEGWKYELSLEMPGGAATAVLTECEDEVDKDGPRHGKLFPVTRFVVHVDEGDPTRAGPDAFLAAMKGKPQRLWSTGEAGCRP